MLENLEGYREEGTGPPLIMVPGLDGTALLFYRQIPLLAERFRVVTFPLPDDSKCMMDSLVQRLYELAGRVGGNEKVLLFGESFGGALSLSFALTHPEKLRGLVILNSFPTIRKRFRIRLAPHLLRVVPWGTMNLVRRFTRSRLHSPHTLPEDLSEFFERTRAVGRKGYIRRLEILRTYDIREWLGAIQVPTLFLAGDQDHLVPSVEEAHFMAARMPKATVKVLRGDGHVCLINHDVNLLEEISPWLAGERRLLET
ncbi:MAG: alpha/beta hydrolase [Vicinamibacteria bacterium]